LTALKKTTQQPLKRGDYKVLVLDIIGSENSQSLHGIQGVVRTVRPRLWKSESVPPDAEETFILDLSHVFSKKTQWYQ